MLPEGFDAWFARCVAANAAARFPDAGVASAALDRLLLEARPSVMPAAQVEVVRPWTLRGVAWERPEGAHPSGPPGALGWALRQEGPRLRWVGHRGARWPSFKQGGSPVAMVWSYNGLVAIQAADGGPWSQYTLHEGLEMPLPATTLTLQTDCQRLALSAMHEAPWMAARGADRYGAWAELRVADETVRLRWIPPGHFVMGSPETEAGRGAQEGPQHTVVLRRGFWMAETPVTEALWRAVMAPEGPPAERPRHPVERVRWDDCVAFCAALQAREPSCGARLPREAEWEYACRGGTEGPNWVGSHDPATLARLAWFSAHSDGSAQPVGSKTANPFGLYDMLGNVWEWCADPLRTYTAAMVHDPEEAPSGGRRAQRGGSWRDVMWMLRAASRLVGECAVGYETVGFRLVCEGP